MIVIWPIPISPRDLVTEVAATEYPLWNEEVAYPAKTRVVTEDGRVWESPLTSVTLPPVAGDPPEVLYNLGRNPAAQSGFLLPYGSVVDPKTYLRPNPTHLNFWWIGISTGAVLDDASVNAYKFLFAPVFDQTEQEEAIVFTVKPRYRLNALAFFNVSAQSISIAYAGATYAKQLTIDNPLSGTLTRVSEVAFTDLPDYDPNGEEAITVTISNPGSVAKCGYFCAGLRSVVGMTLLGTTLTYEDFSRKDRDTFGNVTIIQREYADRVAFAVDVKTSKIAQIRRLLAQLRAVPAVYVALEGNRETLIYGFYRDFTIPFTDYNWSTMQIEIEGLV